MSKNNKVLVLSDDDLRGRDITTILEFVGEEQVLCGDDALALLRQAGEDELADVSVAILNGEDGRVRDWVGMVCKASRSLPLLVVGDPELKGLNDEVAGRVIARLEWPLSYTKFVDSLYRPRCSGNSTVTPWSGAGSGLRNCSAAWWAPAARCRRSVA